MIINISLSFIKREKSTFPNGAKNLFQNSNRCNEYINNPKFPDMNLLELALERAKRLVSTCT